MQNYKETSNIIKNEFLTGKCRSAYKYFGCHKSFEGFVFRVWAPHAKSVSVLGWLLEPVTPMYDVHGNMAYVPNSQTAAHHKLGWYYAPVMMMYSPSGEKAVIVKTDYYAYKSYGWYEYPVVTLYNSRFNCKVVPKSDEWKWNQNGWYTSVASGKTDFLNKIYGTWAAEGTHYGYVPFLDFHGVSCDVGFSFEYCSFGTINSVTLIGNNTYRIDETTIDLIDLYTGYSSRKVSKSVYYIYYCGGNRFQLTTNNGNVSWWKYVGTLDDIVELSNFTHKKYVTI